MMKIRIFCIALTILCLGGSAAFAIAPIGQPTASLRDHWLNLGADYSHTEIDLKAEDIDSKAFHDKGTLKDVKIDLILGKAGFCVTDNWEVFAGLGAAKADFCDERSFQAGDTPQGVPPRIETDKFNLDGDMSFAAQIGTKATFYEKALLKAGVLCQLSWLNLSGNLTEDVYIDGAFVGSGKADIDADLWILQVAPGVSYQLFFGVSVYGGPFYQMVRGEIEGTGKTDALLKSSGTADVREDSSLGGWVGVHADVDILTSLNVEYQFTGSSNTIGLSLVSKF